MLTKWKPFETMWSGLELFESLPGIYEFTGTRSPAVDVYENKDKITVEADLPGIDPEDVEITVDKNILTMRCERKIEKEEKGEKYFRAERMSGMFSRSFTLPTLIKTDEISASYNNGVLKISIPKKPELIPRKIEIKT